MKNLACISILLTLSGTGQEDPGSAMQAMKSTAVGEITVPQQKKPVWMYKFRQTLCKSTKSLSVDNLQAVHHVDITDYSLGAVAPSSQKAVLECPRL